MFGVRRLLHQAPLEMWNHRIRSCKVQAANRSTGDPCNLYNLMTMPWKKLMLLHKYRTGLMFRHRLTYFPFIWSVGWLAILCLILCILFLMVKWPRCWLQLCRQYVLLLHDVHDNTTRDPNGARKCLGLQVWQSKWHVTGPSSQRNQERYIQVRTSTHEITRVHTSHLNLTHPDINFTNFDQPPRTALITCELALDDDDHSKSLHDDVVSNQASQDWFGQSPIVPKLPKNTSKTQSGQWQNSTWFPYVILLPSGFRLASPILRLRQCACPF